jgi:hypothetical protein
VPKSQIRKDVTGCRTDLRICLHLGGLISGLALCVHSHCLRFLFRLRLPPLFGVDRIRLSGT